MGAFAGLIGAILFTWGCRAVLGSPEGTAIGAGLSLMLYGIFDKADDVWTKLAAIRNKMKEKL